MKKKIFFILLSSLWTTQEVTFASTGAGEDATYWYSGFTMANVWRVNETTVNASVGGSITGIEGTISTGVTNQHFSCCINSYASSACNFSGEDQPCKNGVVRMSQTPDKRVYPNP